MKFPKIYILEESDVRESLYASLKLSIRRFINVDLGHCFNHATWTAEYFPPDVKI